MAFTLQSYVADPTLAIAGELPAFIADPTAVSAGQHLQAFVADPTAVPAGAHLQAFIADPTLAIAGQLPAYLTDTPAGQPGKYVSLQQFAKTTVGIVGAVATMAKTPQVFAKSMGGYSAPPKTLQNFTKSMTGVVGVVGSMSKTAKYFTKAMRADPPGSMTKTLRFLSSTKTGLSGAVGSMSKSMEAVTTAKAGYVQVVGATAKTLGLFQKSMAGTFSSSASYITVSMHTERQALTLYTNFPFNSFCQFGGKVYGASDTGLFELTGTTDNGVAIPAIVTGGVSDFGDSHLKVVDRVHVGYRTDGEIAFSITQHDDGQTYRYPLPSNGASGVFGRRVPFGRGLRARYFQWSVANVNGADMKIDSIEFSVRPYGRRIGGSDA